mmetsp:Transcript_16321/g.63667  ORF Transcript_16321/g.63667 Transcript_16321/m.63667 type:complete len:288 (-) Transcript_16321:3088-3951(-)
MAERLHAGIAEAVVAQLQVLDALVQRQRLTQHPRALHAQLVAVQVQRHESGVGLECNADGLEALEAHEVPAEVEMLERRTGGEDLCDLVCAGLLELVAVHVNPRHVAELSLVLELVEEEDKAEVVHVLVGELDRSDVRFPPLYCSDECVDVSPFFAAVVLRSFALLLDRHSLQRLQVLRRRILFLLLLLLLFLLLLLLGLHDACVDAEDVVALAVARLHVHRDSLAIHLLAHALVGGHAVVVVIAAYRQLYGERKALRAHLQHRLRLPVVPRARQRDSKWITLLPDE